MSDEPRTAELLEPRRIATATAVAIAVAAAAAVTYLLLDVILLFFIGMVLAAALQPLHARLCNWGLPRALAILLVYLSPIVGLTLVGLIVVPVLVDQVGTIVGEVPQSYGELRMFLLESGSPALWTLGRGLPAAKTLAPLLAGLAPSVAEGTFGITATIVMLPAYVLSVLAIGFYWTLELPQFERLVLSMVGVDRRPAALNIWHEIEFRLGGYLRGQAMAMFFVGTAAGIGYALIGLPNALVLGVLAGLLEAVPFIGPAAALVPAVLVALPLGWNAVLLVFALAAALQMLESNVLVPRIMQHAVGISSLVSILSLLAFATLYGILGVLIAIPVAAVIQVLIDTLVLHPGAPVADETFDDPKTDLLARLASLQEHARERLRARTNRMGIDPSTADHVVDAMDQQIEQALAHLARAIEHAETDSTRWLPPDAEARCVAKLQAATRRVEKAIALAEEHEAPLPESCLHDLETALARFRDAVDDVEATMAAAPSVEGRPGRLTKRPPGPRQPRPAGRTGVA